MTTGDIGRLVLLSDTSQTVADPAADVRGRTVVDSNGDDVGKVDDLLIDDRENKVRFLRIGEGGFLGIGKQHFLIPVDAIVSIESERIRISRDRGRMAEVPAYDPELEYQPDYYSDLYGWWGYSPFWGAGYTYPPYPYYS